MSLWGWGKFDSILVVDSRRSYMFLWSISIVLCVLASNLMLVGIKDSRPRGLGSNCKREFCFVLRNDS